MLLLYILSLTREGGGGREGGSLTSTIAYNMAKLSISNYKFTYINNQYLKTLVYLLFSFAFFPYFYFSLYFPLLHSQPFP